MTAYVVGFAFDTVGEVYLIRKNRPQWQQGKLNGIGGKIEFRELSINAMTREIKAETGVLVPQARWKAFCSITWPHGDRVDCYTAGLLAGERPETMTDEQVVRLDWQALPFKGWAAYSVVPSLPYLVPMAYSYLYAEAAQVGFHDLQGAPS